MVVQTRDGYLWMTIFDGLARFDSMHFTVFDKSNTPTIQISERSDGDEVLTAYAADRPDWVLMEIEMKRMKRQFPPGAVAAWR